MTINTAIKVGTYFIFVLFAVSLAARGDTEQVVARWRRPVASRVLALDMLHWAMPH
jgi:hypothetical protein